VRLLENEQQQVVGVAARWKAQYCHDGKWDDVWGRDKSSESIYQGLIALPPSATAADVATIIGNDTWVGERCTECGKRNAVLLVGDEPDYESATVYLCAKCARKIAAIIDSIQLLAPAQDEIPKGE